MLGGGLHSQRGHFRHFGISTPIERLLKIRFWILGGVFHK